LLHDYMNPDVFLKLLAFRGILRKNLSPQTLWAPLFYRMDTKNPLKITLGNNFSLSLERDNKYSLPNDISHDLSTILGNKPINDYALSCAVDKGDKIFGGYYVLSNGVVLIRRTEESQPFDIPPVQYIGPNTPLEWMDVVELFGMVDLMGKKQSLIECLKIIDESISDVTTILVDGIAQLYLTNKLNLKMPLYIMGDGICKIMKVALTLYTNPSCVLLLDELENGLHYSLHAKFWAIIASLAAQEKCQIIATTHSYECINSALKGVKKEGLTGVFSYTRLAREDDCIKPKAFTNEILDFALSKDWEVR